jgi:hypothetical protein
LAVEVTLTDKNLTAEKRKMLDTLKDRLSINTDIVEKATRNQTDNKQNSS